MTAIKTMLVLGTIGLGAVLIAKPELLRNFWDWVTELAASPEERQAIHIAKKEAEAVLTRVAFRAPMVHLLPLNAELDIDQEKFSDWLDEKCKTIDEAYQDECQLTCEQGILGDNFLCSRVSDRLLGELESGLTTGRPTKNPYHTIDFKVNVACMNGNEVACDLGCCYLDRCLAALRQGTITPHPDPGWSNRTLTRLLNEFGVKTPPAAAFEEVVIEDDGLSYSRVFRCQGKTGELRTAWGQRNGIPWAQVFRVTSLGFETRLALGVEIPRGNCQFSNRVGYSGFDARGLTKEICLMGGIFGNLVCNLAAKAVTKRVWDWSFGGRLGRSLGTQVVVATEPHLGSRKALELGGGVWKGVEDIGAAVLRKGVVGKAWGCEEAARKSIEECLSIIEQSMPPEYPCDNPPVFHQEKNQ